MVDDFDAINNVLYRKRPTDDLICFPFSICILIRGSSLGAFDLIKLPVRLLCEQQRLVFKFLLSSLQSGLERLRC